MMPFYLASFITCKINKKTKTVVQTFLFASVICAEPRLIFTNIRICLPARYKVKYEKNSIHPLLQTSSSPGNLYF